MPRSLQGRGYVEPFMGSAALFFAVKRRLRPARCTLLDTNAALVNTFRQVRDNLSELLPLLAEHEARHNAPGITEDARRTYYYAQRASSPAEGSAAAAARFIYLNKTCFNGLHRLNRQGGFNVPMGSYKRPTICDAPLLRAASEALADVEIEACPFQDSERFVRDGDFVYADPPYVPLSTSSSFTAYASDPFGPEQQRTLRDLLHRLSDRADWMLSNSAAPLVDELYDRPGMVRHTVWASRAINSRGAGRGPIEERVVTCYRP